MIICFSLKLFTVCEVESGFIVPTRIHCEWIVSHSGDICSLERQISNESPAEPLKAAAV